MLVIHTCAQLCATTRHMASCGWLECVSGSCGDTLQPTTTRHVASCGTKLCTSVCHQHYSNYFCQLFAIYYNKICKTIAYCYKIFEIINCLLHQQIYYYIKIIIKIFRVYYNEIFCSTNLLPQILLQHFA